MPVSVVQQPMMATSLDPYLTTSADLMLKGKEAELSRQFYEKQLELIKSLKLNFACPENEDSLNNAQVSVAERSNLVNCLDKPCRGVLFLRSKMIVTLFPSQPLSLTLIVRFVL